MSLWFVHLKLLNGCYGRQSSSSGYGPYGGSGWLGIRPTENNGVAESHMRADSAFSIALKKGHCEMRPLFSVGGAVLPAYNLFMTFFREDFLIVPWKYFYEMLQLILEIIQDELGHGAGGVGIMPLDHVL
jgi:hypothetical protein